MDPSFTQSRYNNNVTATGNHSLTNETDGPYNYYADYYNNDDYELYQNVSKAMKWICLMIFIGIVILNGVLIGLLLRKRKQSRMSFFVLNLAISDACVGIFYVFPQVFFNYFQVPWNKSYCLGVYGYFSMTSVYVSTYAIIVMTVDRVFIILKPMSLLSKRKAYRYGLASSAWVIGCLLAIQYAINTEFTEFEMCEYKFENALFILWFDFVLILALPVATIVICYIVIIVAFNRRDTHRLLANSETGKSTGCNNISKAKIRTIKLLLVVVIAYIVCWTPEVLNSILISYNVEESFVLPLVLYVLAPLNSLGNPLVFLLFNRKMFRRKEKKPMTSGTTMRTTLDSTCAERIALVKQ